jgi:hypothetical protein
MRDHAHMARAYTAWGQEGLEGLKALLLQGAQDWGLAALRILASETTAQELPMGSPTEPGIVRGVAQRCGRVLTTRKTRGVWGVDAARAQVQTLLRSVKDPHLVAKGTQGKRQGVTRWRTEGGQLVGHTRPLVRRRGHSRARVIPRATAPLGARHEVAKRLIPQPVQWITTGVVAKGTRVQAGVTQARAIVRHKAGTEVALGLPSLLRRLGGGDIFGTMLRSGGDESPRPGQALAGDRAIFGAHATPALVVDDRGGDATTTLQALANAGGKQRGLQPKGHGAWHVAEAVRETVRSECGTTEGIMGTLKTDTEGFNKPKERLWQPLEMAGPRSILSYNLNTFMRDLIRADRCGEKALGKEAPQKQRPSRGKREAQRHLITLEGVLRHALLRRFLKKNFLIQDVRTGLIKMSYLGNA